MNTAYWIFEYTKVLFGYFFLMFLWPSVVFFRHLKKKSPIYRFGFCVSVQTTLVNTVVLGLGLIHILNPWIMGAVFWGIPVVSIWRNVSRLEIDSRSFLHVVSISRGKILLQRAAAAGRKRLKAAWKSHLRQHIWEYLALAAVCVYSLIYFSWGSFQTTCYGFGDMYVHHSWIYGLVEGTPFVKGVYPEAMHCVIYSIHALLGVQVFSLMLFFGSIQSTAFILASYCLLREFFCCRYTPVLVSTAFLLLYTEPWRELDGVTRLQWTLPLEFGLAMQMLCVLFLIRYLKCENEKSTDFLMGMRRILRLCKNAFVRFFPKLLQNLRFGASRSRSTADGGKTCYFVDDNLFVFAMALSATFSAHFYPLILAFFMCLGVAAFYLKKIFSRARFLPLAVAVLCGLMISVTPMAASLASGNRLQGSIGWGISVMAGRADESRGKPQETELEQAQPSDFEQEDEQFDLAGIFFSMGKLIQLGFEELVGESRSGFFFMLAAVIIPACLVLRLTMFLFPPSLQERIKSCGVDRLWFSRYPLLLIMVMLLLLLYLAPNMGLPELVLGVRLASTERILIFALGAIPLDFIFCLILLLKRTIPQVIPIACLAVLCIWGISEKNYHEYLYCELTRYRMEVSVLNSIIQEYPQYQYTIVSPTDGLYHVNEYGRHEELILFVQQAAEERYFLPTEYVFMFIEKHPLEYAQRYYFSGPSWLARGKTEPSIVSGSEISKEAAQSRKSLPISFKSYTSLENRTIVESKAYYWCKKFAELYPYEMNVYYEDDNFVCYCFQQETHSPFNLAIDYEDLYE